MTRRFSSAQLRFLRNRVPIDRVVETLFDACIQNKSGKRLFQNIATNKIHNAQPCAIGDILPHVMPSLSQCKTDVPSLESIAEKISRLEHRLRHIDRVVSELQSFLNQ